MLRELQQHLLAVNGIKHGEYQVVFISPESHLSGDKYSVVIYIISNLVGFIVDEAHCIKKW